MNEVKTGQTVNEIRRAAATSANRCRPLPDGGGFPQPIGSPAAEKPPGWRRKDHLLHGVKQRVYSFSEAEAATLFTGTTSALMLTSAAP